MPDALHRAWRWIVYLLAFAVAWRPALALPVAAPGPAPIQDNSFLVEEAYNQEKGVVQHISSFTRYWNSRDWIYTFTQEWPGVRNPRHQYSYTVAGMHAGAFHDSGAGLGDIALNYRYQWVGSGESRVAVAPRWSLLLPVGNPDRGRGTGGPGIQVNLPASVAVSRRVVTHWNAGATYTRRARNAAGDRADLYGYTFAQSMVLLAHPRLNALLETSFNAFQSVTGRGSADWDRLLYISPGIRWAYNLPSGLQVVPGVAVPVGVGFNREWGLLVYLSFEHPLRRHPKN